MKRAKPYAKGLAQAKVSSSDDLSMDKDEYLSRILVTPDLIIDDPDSYTSQIMPKLSVVMNASSTTNEVMSSDGEVQPVDLQQRTVQQNIKMKYCNCQVNHSAIAERKLQPILFFINKNSGGRLGAELIRTLKSFEFHPIQICDLRNERPEEKLLLFKNSSESVHVLSAGGDGTVNWLLNVLYKLDMNVASFGVIPLGTGNDLYLQIVNHIKSQEEDKDVPEHLRQLPVSPKYLVLAPMQVLAGHMRNMMGEIADGNGDIDNAVISKSADSELESGSGGSSLDASNTAGSEVAVAVQKKDKENMLEVADRSMQLDRWSVKITGKDRKERKDKKAKKRVGLFGHRREVEAIDKELAESATIEANVVHTLKSGALRRKKLNNYLRSSFRRFGRLINPLRYLMPRFGPGKREMPFSNYVGFGVDGAVSLTMDTMRSYAPLLFFHSYVNKFWYGICGLFQIAFGIKRDLSQNAKLICDDKEIAIPPGIRGLVVLNINSYAGGVTLWNPEMIPLNSYADVRRGDSVLGEVKWGSARCDDGVLEVMGVYGVRHLGLIKSGIGKAVPLCQGKKLSFQFDNLIPMQVDGEPFMVRPCVVNITHLQSVNITTPTLPF